MSLKEVGPGANAPDEINVVVEIPANTGPVKYEVDKASGAVFVDRFMRTAMFYPCNYGYVPDSLADDGDPLDVMVVTPHPLIAGTVITCRPVGVLEMEDEAGDDAKIVAVPISKVARIYDHVQAAADLPEGLIHTIEHFFAHYKDLERGKWVKVRGWGDAAAARAYIDKALRRVAEGENLE
ncbi:MAG: inorganic diphosphatase [Pseudomonadales bacterium]